ncbi:bifunctional [glutamine synthetase] adenylyltransferase/[glutamine synthetase]-adenylyl-L-tyrosine phosphorylase [Acidisoma cladoniae]|jgi:glutamate-ammonia-ligase adenylyltransferase|uniref:bifunctional [glutamine synthetase] adenylyltransferase/[glutamine synthetase]-adenylyl-L-tyrosine phosphorylase n=1 Tax=Acidisoma cladoniae TaxID=3040935 RepID=UPI00254EB576|nr:bifunctional [glutamine synthetase] adenylyltransferase/[glutamine synthetase]-adenylyl-L-tyrosine phosphorylase [Acidisoma sp. PAMC 29798]
MTVPAIQSPWHVHWPEAGDADAAARFVATFQTTAGEPDVPLAMLRAIGGNSPYLSELALREPAVLRDVAAHGPDAAAQRAFAALAATPFAATPDRVAAAMRQAKRTVALIAALGDIGGAWSLSRVTGALSRLAEETLQLGCRHLLARAHTRGEIILPAPERDPAEGSGLIVLALGKLGGRELNYSSDIDLIVFFDPAAAAFPSDTIAAFYARLARDLVTLMEARDAGGYVFRVDLRLRPDPAAMPLAVSVPAALTYYETVGRNWERAAFLKARPVAGDIGLGQDFLEALRPFIWRRHLDFAAIADINAMKRRMDAHRGGPIPNGPDPVARVTGHNLKIGRGGIREIEFLAQTQQLVWGGREPVLRVGATLPALRLLSRLRHMSSDTAAILTRAYRFLRQVEHRVQMVADRQTHALPETAFGVGSVATFMGFATPRAFAETLLTHLMAVQAIYDSYFDSRDDADVIEFGAPDTPPPIETLRRLQALGFADCPKIVAAIRRWLAGQPRALRSERARALLEPLLTHILTSLAAQPEPDHAFARFDHFIAGLPAGIQLLSLFQHNPALIDRIAALLGAAPALADHLALHPGSLEGLLASDETRADPARVLGRQLGDARTLEDSIGLTRHFVSEESFRIGVATLEGRMDVDAAGIARAALADAALGAVLGAVVASHTDRYGWLPGAGFAIVLMGKGGGREMMPGSDLDLMFIYDQAEEAAESVGPKPLAPSQWFARLTTTFTTALTAQGVEGPMYQVDMRLRPSGNQGPVAVSLPAFRIYHAEQAWTWEQMALTRARVVAGIDPFRTKVDAAILEGLRPRRTAALLRENAQAMRRRLLQELPPIGPWDVKLRAGGLMEVEFVAQVLQLIHFVDRPTLRSTTTRIALANLAEIGAIDGAEAATLIAADHLWRTIQTMLRLTVGEMTGLALPKPSARTLLAATDEATIEGLRLTIARTAEAVRDSFIRHIGDPGPIDAPAPHPPSRRR